MNLEDFNTKALRLVKEAEYSDGATWDRILRDTLISGMASEDKICAKITKEGKDVTLARVTEIARLEVSTQKHIDRMEDTAKVNYVQYGKGSKKESQNLVAAKLVVAVETVAALETLLNPEERARKLHS